MANQECKKCHGSGIVWIETDRVSPLGFWLVTVGIMSEKPEYMQRKYWEAFNQAMGLPTIYPNHRQPTGPEKGFLQSNAEERPGYEEPEFTTSPEGKRRRARPK